MRRDAELLPAIPAGQVTYSRALSHSPLGLDPERFTALGPQPEDTFFYGHVAGRVNAIAIDPLTPNVAYIASNGGGVWKTTNCCTTTTTWAVTTDHPGIYETAVDALEIDPSNHNIVYAGTGDLNFPPSPTAAMVSSRVQIKGQPGR